MAGEGRVQPKPPNLELTVETPLNRLLEGEWEILQTAVRVTAKWEMNLSCWTTITPFFVDEEDPNWPEEAEDGWGFRLSEFFNEVKIKNVRDEEDEDYLTEDEMEWEDDDHACTVKVMTSKEWEDAVFRDISPLVLLIYERYERAKDSWKARKELDKAIHIFWDSNKPSPRAFMVDAAIETELVSALKVEDCPVILFIKAGRILHCETEILTAEEFAKIMAYFYYGASRPACLKNMEPILDEVPSLV